MARLDNLPATSIVKGFKGTIDFYLWMGRLPVARRWPRKDTQPDTPLEQIAQQEWKLLTQSWKDLDALFKLAASAMAAGTQQRNIDAFQSYAYGRLIIPRPDFALATSLEASLTTIPIATSPTVTATTIAVNNVSYMFPPNLQLYIPFDLITFNKYRLTGRAGSNASGQTIDVRVQEAAGLIPLGDGTPDVTLPFNGTLFDSGPKDVINAPVLNTAYQLALKGSNSTVDLLYWFFTLSLWQEP